MILTEKEMVRLWLLRKGYEPLRSDCTITRSDGNDLEGLARIECRLWYENLLLNGPDSLLIPHDLANSTDLKIAMTLANSIMVTLPDNCIRPIAVKLSSWLAPAIIVDADSPLARRQYTPYCAGGITAPVAVRHPNNCLELFSPAYENSDTLTALLCIVRQTDADNPDELIYEFQPAALDTAN